MTCARVRNGQVRETIVEFLAKNPLFLLFSIAAIGYPIGRIRVAGISLGIASLLFVGIALGAIDPRLKLPETFYQFGLAIFVYTIGLSSAPGFFASLNRRGLRNTALVVGILLTGALFSSIAIVVISRSYDLGTGIRALQAGLFTGSFTNTPAMAAARELIKMRGGDAAMQSQPVVAYSIAYPMAVIGPMLALILVKKLFKVDYAAEAASLPNTLTGMQEVKSETVRVTSASNHLIRDIVHQVPGARVVFGRVHRNGTTIIPQGETELQNGDLVTVVGTADDLSRIETLLGEKAPYELPDDRTEVDYRRMFVSNSAVVGIPLRELHLVGRHNAVITRIRRGDTEFVPDGDTVMEFGDRVRITTRKDNMEAVAHIIGDSYRSISEVDLLNFCLGLALGLALGKLPIPLPGGLKIELGFAGGPLLVALILGRVHRFGRFNWSMPYSANLTLRQLGLMLFAAGVGTTAGEGFAKTVQAGLAVPLFVGGAAVSFVSATLLLLIGYRLMKIPLGVLSGVMSGCHTQPVLLGFANEQAKNDLPSLGYSMVFPAATILKIIVAQLLLSL